MSKFIAKKPLIKKILFEYFNQFSKWFLIFTSSLIIFSSVDYSHLPKVNYSSDKILDHAMNLQGIPEAKSISTKNGEVIFSSEEQVQVQEVKCQQGLCHKKIK